MELFKLLGKIAIDNSEANSNIDETTKKASTAGSGMTGAFKKIGAAVGTYFAVDKIIDFGKGCIQAAADANAANSQFTQVFGELEGKAKESLTGIADETGIVENRMKGSYTQIAAFAKTTGMDTEGALNLTNRAMVAVADSAAFYDRSLEDTTESLQSFLKGNYENDAALGLSCTETTRNAAANKLYGKSFKDLSESQKQLTLLQMVEDANKLSGAVGQAARESNTWTNQTGNLKQAWTDFQAILGKPILDGVVNIIGGLAEKITGLTQKIVEGGNPVQGFVDKIGKLKNWFVDVGSYVISTFQPTFENLKNAFTAVKDTVQPLVDKLIDYVTNGGLAEGVTNGIKTAADLLSGAFEKATGLIEGIATGFQNAVQWGKEHETGLTLIATAMGTLTAAIGAYNIVQAIKNAGGIVEIAQLAATAIGVGALTVAETAHSIAAGVAAVATTAFGAAVQFLTSPITLVILAIGALIAIGVLLYKNWDTVKAKTSEVWDAIKEWVSGAWESIKTAWGSVCEFFSGLWESVKTVFFTFVDWINTTFIQPIIAFFTGLWDSIKTVWDGICNAVQVAIMFIGSILSAAFTIITLPFQMIWENCKGIIMTAWEAIKSAVSTAMTAIQNTITVIWNAIKAVITPIINGIKNVITTAWNNIKTAISTVVNAIKTVVTTVWNAIKTATTTAFNAVKSVVSSVWNGIKSVISNVVNSIKSVVTNIWNSIKTTTSTVFNAVKSVASSVWNGIKSTVSNVVNGVKSTVSNVWNSIKSTTSSVFNGIKSTASSVWNNIKTAISTPINKARDTVKAAIDKIKSFFNFKWSLPKLKMPHFKISGKFSLDPPSVPKLSVDWYKKAMNNAMLLDEPTIFGYNAANGKFLGAGEAGSEVVAGSTTLMGMIRNAVAEENGTIACYLKKIIEVLATYFPQLVEAMDVDVYLDSGALVGELAAPMNQALGKLSIRKERGR